MSLIGRPASAPGASAAMIALLLLGGCSTSSEIADMTCPQGIAAPGADILAVLKPGGHEAGDMEAAARVSSVTVSCTHLKNGIDADTAIQFYGQRANPDFPSMAMTYFVAVVDRNENVLTERNLDIKLEFYPGENYRWSVPQHVTVHLPVRRSSSGGEFAIVVGFHLTPDQLAFNRAQHPQ